MEEEEARVKKRGTKRRGHPEKKRLHARHVTSHDENQHGHTRQRTLKPCPTDKNNAKNKGRCSVQLALLAVSVSATGTFSLCLSRSLAAHTTRKA